jgi:hypothetical protein
MSRKNHEIAHNLVKRALEAAIKELVDKKNVARQIQEDEEDELPSYNEVVAKKMAVISLKESEEERKLTLNLNKDLTDTIWLACISKQIADATLPQQKVIELFDNFKHKEVLSGGNLRLIENYKNGVLFFNQQDGFYLDYHDGLKLLNISPDDYDKVRFFMNQIQADIWLIINKVFSSKVAGQGDSENKFVEQLIKRKCYLECEKLADFRKQIDDFCLHLHKEGKLICLNRFILFAVGSFSLSLDQIFDELIEGRREGEKNFRAVVEHLKDASEDDLPIFFKKFNSFLGKVINNLAKGGREGLLSCNLFFRALRTKDIESGISFFNKFCSFLEKNSKEYQKEVGNFLSLVCNIEKLHDYVIADEKDGVCATVFGLLMANRNFNLAKIVVEKTNIFSAKRVVKMEKPLKSDLGVFIPNHFAKIQDRELKSKGVEVFNLASLKFHEILYEFKSKSPPKKETSNLRNSWSPPKASVASASSSAIDENKDKASPLNL